MLKERPKWDEAQNLFKNKELTMERNEYKVVLDQIRELRS